MRRLFGTTLIAALAFASAAPASAVPGSATGGLPTPTPSNRNVVIDHWKFTPKDLVILPGTTVVWVNQGNGYHTSISDDGLWNSHGIPPGATFSYTFTAPGTYAYHCRFGNGIFGQVQVLGADG
jgi:plastocyanin